MTCGDAAPHEPHRKLGDGRPCDGVTPRPPEPCRFGRTEYDGARYCFEHAGFLEAGIQSRRCDRA